METVHANETIAAEESIAPPKKAQRTFLYAFVKTSDGQHQLVGPCTKPALRTEIAKLGNPEIITMIAGQEKKFSTVSVISFS